MEASLATSVPYRCARWCGTISMSFMRLSRPVIATCNMERYQIADQSQLDVHRKCRLLLRLRDADCDRDVSIDRGLRFLVGGGLPFIPGNLLPCDARRTPASARSALTSHANDRHAASRTYSITSLARASSVGGTSRPSARAVLRLIVNSYVVGCSTGISAGLLPRRIRPTKLPSSR